jgi:hypothetical protein
MQCLLLLLVVVVVVVFNQDSSDIDMPWVCMYYKFWPIAPIVRYIELLQSPFFLSVIPPYA